MECETIPANYTPCNLTYSTKWTPANQIVYINSSTTSTGSIILNASNIVLDCNGGTVIGNSTGRGIDFNFKNNITIQNCYFSNYTDAIYMSTSFNNTLNNIHIDKINRYGIYITKVNNTLINNSNISQAISTASSIQGIRFESSWGYNNIISNSIFSNIYQGIRFQSGNYNNTQLLTNNFSSMYDDAILILAANYTTVSNNRIVSGYNGVDFSGIYNNISNNYIEGFTHNGIDNKDNSDNFGILNGWNSLIYNNIINDTNLSSTNSIYIVSSNNNQVYGNTIYGRSNGISLEGNNSICYNNLVYGNTIQNANISLYSGCVNTNWSNNIITETKLYDVYFSSLFNNLFNLENSTFVNNIYSKKASFFGVLSNTSVKFTENLNYYANVTLNVGKFPYGSTLFNYNGLKNFKVTNNTFEYYNLTVNPQGYSFVDIFYSNQSLPVASDVKEWNQTIASGNRTIVLSYTTSTKWVKEVPIGTSDISYSYSSSTKTLTITCTGSGFTTQNMDNLKGASGFYNVYHDGVKQSPSSLSNYTATSCSQWDFSPNELYANYSPMVTNLLYVILATMIVLVFIFLVGKMLNNSAEWTVEYLVFLIIAIIIIGILLNFIAQYF